MSELTLGQLRDMFSKLPKDRVLQYGLSEPFSWRGSYNEVAFSIEKNVSVYDCLARIDNALYDAFCGYKGGTYEYNEFTTVHFERDESACTYGEYAKEILREIIGEAYSVEERLLMIMTEEE